MLRAAPNNSFDRQYDKFQVPLGAYRESEDIDFDFRVRLSRMIVEHQIQLLERKRAAADLRGKCNQVG